MKALLNFGGWALGTIGAILIFMGSVPRAQAIDNFKGWFEPVTFTEPQGLQDQVGLLSLFQFNPAQLVGGALLVGATLLLGLGMGRNNNAQRP